MVVPLSLKASLEKPFFQSYCLWSLQMNSQPEIWIVDDERSIRWVLEKALTQEALRVRSFENGDLMLAALPHANPDIIISDIRMPGIDGLALLSLVKENYPEIPVIIMTAHSDLDSAVSSISGGAYEYLPKPFEVDEATALVKRALRHRKDMESEVADPLESEENPEIIGKAPAMQEVFRAIGRLSKSNVTVLINGQSGTGKELVARALHKHSPRSAEAFVALNMAAIPADLIESELFGHEKGRVHRGKFSA
jgi:two-component system nitrogen regulation response regulator GlnG